MSDIRTKLLGLTALATAFAGLSYGQSITFTSAGVPNNPSIRAEGETELVADAVATFTTTAGPTTGSVQATLSLPVTSKTETVTSTYAGNSDAILQVFTGSTNLGTPTYVYPGTVIGGQVNFAGVTFPNGAFTLQVSNIRVNASGATNPQVTETILVQYTTSTSTVQQNVVSASENVGYVQTSLILSLLQNSSLQNMFYGGTSSNFQTCTGEPLSGTTAPTPAFTLQIKENFAGAFRTLALEGGSYTLPVGGISTIGAATQATELQVAFTNVPAAATIYLPISVSSGGTTLTLQGSVTALSSPASLVNLATSGVFGFTPTAGAISATYVVTNDISTGGTFSLPVYLQVAAGAAPVQTTAVTVAVTYLPTATVTGPTALIPSFATSTVVPLNTLTVTACTTSILFPFVTNVAGFETGFAIANTTTDNLASNGTKSSASASTGTCTMYFYGSSATNPPSFTTPTSVGVYSATTGASPVYANTLTSMAGPGFEGYAIATCSFLDAHGFAYIVDNFGTTSGTAEGYLGLILPSSRGSADGGLNN